MSLAIVRIKPGSLVLDIACGWGANLEYLAAAVAACGQSWEFVQLNTRRLDEIVWTNYERYLSPRVKALANHWRPMCR